MDYSIKIYHDRGEYTYVHKTDYSENSAEVRTNSVELSIIDRIKRDGIIFSDPYFSHIPYIRIKEIEIKRL